MDASTHDKWLLSHECLCVEECPPLHKETVHLIIMCDVAQFHPQSMESVHYTVVKCPITDKGMQYAL
jgi:hypothetical protein